MIFDLTTGLKPTALCGLVLASVLPLCGGEVSFNVGAGFFEDAIEVRLSTSGTDAGKAIRFTRDGSTPSEENSQRYETPLRLTNTTVLRAAVFESNARASEVSTRTFIFTRDVLRQTGADFPTIWGTNNGQPVPADYEMDPEIVNHPAYRDQMVEALKSVPTLSLVSSREDLFDPGRGIYANPRASGDEWERPASIEWIHPSNPRGFQINGGLRIQGGWNRRPEESPKHAFRLVFRKKYGAGKLKFPVFGGVGAREFDTLILRAGCNNTWLHWDGIERRRGDFLRDQWMRDTHRAMGHPAAAGVFVHLYLNGLYWGLYNLTERPDADFAVARFGGRASDYDARNGENILEGDSATWDKLFTLANDGLRGAQAYAAAETWLDVPAFIDYMLLNFYGANGDWDRHSNWYAIRRREPPGQFRFVVWDAERTLEFAPTNTMAFDDDQSPPRLFHKLRENSVFRRLFAERARRHGSGEGALSPKAAAQRYRALAQEIELAVIAESARWGDYRRDAHRYKVGPYELYTRDDHWRVEVGRLLKEFFPQRTEIFLNQLAEAGLY